MKYQFSNFQRFIQERVYKVPDREKETIEEKEIKSKGGRNWEKNSISKKNYLTRYLVYFIKTGKYETALRIWI